MFKFISAGASVVGALIAFTGTANAAETVKVSYGDLDLGSAHGAAIFDARTTKAAQRYCRSEPRPVTTFIRDFRGCMADVRGDVFDQLPRQQRLALAAAWSEGAPTVLAAR